MKYKYCGFCDGGNKAEYIWGDEPICDDCLGEQAYDIVIDNLKILNIKKIDAKIQ